MDRGPASVSIVVAWVHSFEVPCVVLEIPIDEGRQPNAEDTELGLVTSSTVLSEERGKTFLSGFAKAIKVWCEG